MAAPLENLRPSGDGTSTRPRRPVPARVRAGLEALIFSAAGNGNLSLLKGTIEILGRINGDRASVFSIKMGDYGVLHCAASSGNIEVCKYLVEELEADATMTAANGATAPMTSAQSDDVSTVKYFLDHGGDMMKVDIKGRTVLHHAATTGSSKVTAFLLSKGIPVDIEYGRGTPLYQAAISGHDVTLKILLDHHANPNIIFDGIFTPLTGALHSHSLKCMKLLIKAGADVNGKGSTASPLVHAIHRGGCTNEIRLLLEAGADPKIPDDLDRLPVEVAALNDRREEVELLFPLTSPIPGVQNWSVDGLISRAKLEKQKPLEERHIAKRKAMFKSMASNAFKLKDYETASTCYGLAIDHKPDATLYSNRSLCRLRMGDGEGALSDANKCRMMRPDWAKACYRQAAALMLLGENHKACIALLVAQKLDPGDEEIEKELRKAMALRDASRDEDQQ